MIINIVNRCKDIPAPSAATELSSGFDLRAAVEEEVRIGPGERRLVPTGISIEIPAGFEGQVRGRSGLALRNGIGLVNSPGTIDSDYRGEIGAILINLGAEDFVIRRGDRIAQLVIAPVALCRLVAVESLVPTTRGEGGFGSTGER